ncbi:type IV pilus assembly protein PilO [Paenibacillus taihuensis]|uniref:Type IV pilus assembly protein PilO n=1 Tax=Paenibacillus taihuensis TaxID=1156355 RepID=A0A3D9QZR9_9BACL|nr:type 4a pilus biogenesis protein PilO [Paenibacillus taihuensis]REE66670.1 type IV pilus assembly protein PilO [Paenibacillus taihuensis]
MEQLNKNRSLAVLLIAVLFLILFAAYSFVIKPSSGSNSDQQAEIDRLTGQTELLSKKLAEKKESNKSYSEAGVQNALPLWDNTEQLLLDLQSIEQQTSATTITATFSPDSDGKQADGETDSASLGNIGLDTSSDNATAGNSSSAELGSYVKKLGVSVVIKGSYTNVLHYVEKLQTMPRLITVDSFDIAKSSSADKPLSASITFTAYFDPSYKSLVKQMVLPYTE